MTLEEYCSQVCKAKCCHTRTGQRCPHLQTTCRCGIYAERFALGEPDKTVVARTRETDPATGKEYLRSWVCGRIAVLIRQGEIPQEIVDQCAVAHPELLQKGEAG